MSTGVPPDVTVLHNQCGQPLHNSSINQSMNSNSGPYTPTYQVRSSTPPVSQGINTTVKQPHSILKDPARKLHNVNSPGTNQQILSVQGASYEGVNQGLTTFSQPGMMNFPETEGHLV